MFKAESSRQKHRWTRQGRSKVCYQIFFVLAVSMLSSSIRAEEPVADSSTATAPVVSAQTGAAPVDTTPTTSARAATALPSQIAPASAASSPTLSLPLPASTGAAPVRPLPDALSPVSMFIQADIVVKAVMVGLALASMATWTVLLVKMIQLRAARREARTALAIVLSARSLMDAVRQTGHEKGAIDRLLAMADDEIEKSRGLAADGIKERVAWQFERIEAAAVQRIGRGMGILATIGAVAPFVGLFGTVWGIMNSFIGISQSHTTNLAVVAPGIAEALLATAFGLVAAIPAVVIYNAFARATGGYRSVLADASVAILRLLSRDLDRQSLPTESRRGIRAAEAPRLSIADSAE